MDSWWDCTFLRGTSFLMVLFSACGSCNCAKWKRWFKLITDKSSTLYDRTGHKTYPRWRETFNRWCYNVGPALHMVDHHYNTIGSTYRDCRTCTLRQYCDKKPDVGIMPYSYWMIWWFEELLIVQHKNESIAHSKPSKSSELLYMSIHNHDDKHPVSSLRAHLKQ